MISNYRYIENQYLTIFSESEDKEDHTVYWDERLPGMYAFNCIFIKETMRESSIGSFVESHIQSAKLDRDFLRIIFHPTHQLSDRLKEDFLQLGFQLQNSLYMRLRDDITSLQGNVDGIVKRSSSDKELDDGEMLDVATSIDAGMPKDFSRRKAARKKEIYADVDKALFSYLCYHKDQAIGKCELYIEGNYAKIEDFDVLHTHQRMGFGTAILGRIISDARASGSEHIYLVASEDDTPQEMYKKLGFEVIGRETEITWLSDKQ